MKRFVFAALLAAGLVALSSCYHSRTCATYADNTDQTTVQENN